MKDRHRRIISVSACPDVWLKCYSPKNFFVSFLAVSIS